MSYRYFLRLQHLNMVAFQLVQMDYLTFNGRVQRHLLYVLLDITISPAHSIDISLRYNTTSSHRPSPKTTRIQGQESNCLDSQARDVHHFAHFGV
jgi:hypothetical protein